MKQIIQSFRTGELWLADVPAPACKSSGAMVQTSTSFVSAGTERMLVDFAKKGMVGKAIAMPDQVKKALKTDPIRWQHLISQGDQFMTIRSTDFMWLIITTMLFESYILNLVLGSMKFTFLIK